LTAAELVQAVVPVMWEHLWADGVLRKGLDTQRILDVRVRLEALQATITALDDEARQLRTRSEAVMARARATADKDSRSDCSSKQSKPRTQAMPTTRNWLASKEPSSSRRRNLRTPLAPLWRFPEDVP
jgi:septal ring factor EnvC (AmiA/AmiB activator)